MNTELLQFAMHLTGHGEEDIEQMYNDWINSPSTPSFAPEQAEVSKTDEEDIYDAVAQYRKDHPQQLSQQQQLKIFSEKEGQFEAGQYYINFNYSPVQHSFVVLLLAEWIREMEAPKQEKAKEIHY
jgi:hypothetical protein